MPGSRVLVIDNYDSFVYNLVQYLGELGAEPLVHRNDDLTVAQAVELEPGLLWSHGAHRVLSSIRPFTSSIASCTWPCTSRLS